MQEPKYLYFLMGACLGGEVFARLRGGLSSQANRGGVRTVRVLCSDVFSCDAGQELSFWLVDLR